MNYTRQCGKCDKTILHISKAALNKALKRTSICRSCAKKKPIDPSIVTKWCPGCEETLSFKEFAKDATHRLGLQSRCKKCCNKYTREIYYPKNKDKVKKRGADRHRKIKQWLREIKSVPCADCNVTYDPVCMDFDHLPEHEKSFNISNYLRQGGNWTKIQEEIAKCEIVCSNCHRLRSKNRTLEANS